MSFQPITITGILHISAVIFRCPDNICICKHLNRAIEYCKYKDRLGILDKLFSKMFLNYSITSTSSYVPSPWEDCGGTRVLRLQGLNIIQKA